MSSRRCARKDCGEFVAADAPAHRKYCSDRCRKTLEARRYRARKRTTDRPRRVDGLPLDEPPTRISKAESTDGRASARRGPAYEAFCATVHPELIDRGEASVGQVATLLGTTAANVSRWMAAWVEDRGRAVSREDWTRPVEVEEALADFGAFCRRYWPDDQITGFHMEWADLISEAIDEGGRALLLAAQRHGKSSLLRKYCAWRICRDPNIRILWVSQSQGLAEKSVGYVLDILTTHEQLREDVLGPGGEFRPPQRHNMSWTREEFTVGCRTKLQASPTMVALGKGGSILSRDADVLIVDDLQEHKHIRSPGQRENDVEWFFTDLMSRKLPNTGVAVIGSRQHLQDIYSEIIKRGDEWTIRVYPVHDPGCTLPEDDHAAHDVSGCMLWPQQYPHGFMQEQRAQQGEAFFQRNMMNNPKADATILVSARDLERCRDYDRRVGEIPEGVTRLIAGIDPADAKPVAGVLWGFEPAWAHPSRPDRLIGRRHIIDTIEADAGIRGGRHIIRHWNALYGCTFFVMESNMAQSWLEDADIRDLIAGRIHLKPQYTSASTKWDHATGVVAMFGRMRTDPPSITIPWGDRETVKKMGRLASTFLTFDPDYAGNKHADDDLPMAAWFPQLTMDSWVVPATASAKVEYRQTVWSSGWATPWVPSSDVFATNEPEVA